MQSFPLVRAGSRARRLVIFVLSLMTAGVTTGAETAAKPAELPLLSPIFGDKMVLQRGKPNSFWGWSQPGQKVSVAIEGHAAETVADADGKWSVAVEVPPAGGPYEVSVTGGQTVVLHQVLVGDVWLCGGQSNMLFSLQGSTRGEAEVKEANHPDLRLYLVGSKTSYAPSRVVHGEWKICTPESAAEFSAVAYFFARKLQAELHVPIGLIEDCVGGSPVESWMSAGALAHLGELTPQLAEIQRLSEKPGPQYGSFLMHWLQEFDAGSQGAGWAGTDLDDTRWKPVQIPGGFAELGLADYPGVAWFRREITLPDKIPAGPARIFLGEVDKMDTTYINGHWVGASSWVENPRVYVIPADVLKPGRNVVAVRVFKAKPTGGFLSKAELLRLQFSDDSVIPLAGAWKAAVGVDARPPHPLPLDLENYPTMPTVLYNGMIAPIAPVALAGVIWYQGEANTPHAGQYRRLLTALIADWRVRFQQDDLPFYLAELPAFSARRAEPGSDGWAELREAQAQVVQTVPGTGMAVTIDTGEADNIHPREKQPVGERLALSALARHYHLAVEDSGPVFHSVERLPGELKLHFTRIANGLVIHGDKLGEFSVAGEDRQWHWARARIEGDAVIVSAPEVPSPVAARYAWQSNPVATLFNTAALPAAPFRTDDWPLASGQ